MIFRTFNAKTITVLVLAGVLSSCADFGKVSQKDTSSIAVDEGNKDASLGAIGESFPTSPQVSKRYSAAIVHGDPLYKEQWPASLMFSTGLGRCTSTLVSEDVMLVAAHCGPYNGIDAAARSWSAWILSAPGTYSNKMECSNHPDVKFAHLPTYDDSGNPTGKTQITDVSADFALCKLEEPIALKSYEGIFSGDFKRPQNIFLHGYGCTSEAQLNRQIQRHYGTLLGGVAQIKEELSDRFTSEGNTYVCPGDSGGSAFIYFDRGRIDGYQSRAVVGVNSMVGREDGQRISIIADTTTPLFTNWARKWANESGVEICGITENPKKCRYK